MKLVTLIVGLLFLGNLCAQIRYSLPSKTERFSQGEWLEILSDIANDTQVIREMKHCKSGMIEIHNKPYVCYVNEEHPIVLQFCPECIWIVDSCVSNCNIGTISVSARGDYDFHVDHVVVQDMWNPGDTVTALMYVLHTPVTLTGSVMSECYLIPIAANMIIPGYPIFPNKKRKRTK